MIPNEDGRDNIEDWFFLENAKGKKVNKAESFTSGQASPDDIAKRKATKSFIENELHAMSTLSLYDDSLDKMRLPGEADK
jgi:hypothetical protein